MPVARHFNGLSVLLLTMLLQGCGPSKPIPEPEAPTAKAVYPPILEGLDYTKGRTIWIKSCKLCHEDGGEDDAPILGDIPDWADRTSDSLPELYERAKHGVGHMPAMLGRKGLTHEDIKTAVDYMVEASR